MEQDQVCTAFYAVAKLAEVLKESPIRDKIWEHQIDRHWFIKINGYSKQVNGIPPYNMFIEFNGYPAGILSPFDGTIAAGTEANEDTFIEAVKKKLESLGENLDDLQEEDLRKQPSKFNPEDWAEEC